MVAGCLDAQIAVRAQSDLGAALVLQLVDFELEHFEVVVDAGRSGRVRGGSGRSDSGKEEGIGILILKSKKYCRTYICTGLTDMRLSRTSEVACE